MPSVHCVTPSLTKLTMMRGENCMEARVRVISRIAKTIETTVMMEVGITDRMTWATCGSAREGKSAYGTQALAPGTVPSIQDKRAPAHPSVTAIVNGRTRKPPRKLYMAWRTHNGSRICLIQFSIHLRV